MSSSNRITKPGYEAYHLVIVARQLGLNQIAPSFIIHENFQSRANFTECLIASRAYNLFSELVILMPHDLEFTYSSEGFSAWWTHWKAHLFCGPLGILLIGIDPSHVPTQDEVNLPIQSSPGSTASLLLN